MEAPTAEERARELAKPFLEVHGPDKNWCGTFTASANAAIIRRFTEAIRAAEAQASTSARNAALEEAASEAALSTTTMTAFQEPDRIEFAVKNMHKLRDVIADNIRALKSEGGQP